MSSMVDVIRSVVRLELATVRGPALGVISGVHPHAADGDDFNDEVDVRLQHEGSELAGVPVAVRRPGVSEPLKKGDLVLVQFLDGDFQQPLVTACFHTDDQRPPTHPEGEHVVEQRIDGKPRNRIRWAIDGRITLEHFDDKGAVTVTLVLDKEGNLQVTADKKEITVTCKTFAVTGDATIKGNVVIDGGNLDVKNGTVAATHSGGTTTIDGTTITGS